MRHLFTDSRARRRAISASGASLLAIVAMGSAAPAFAQTATQDQPEVQSGEEIIVTGRREALQTADSRKKNSDTIIDSVVADDAGKLPDNSITEVLQRVSGVTIVRFSALNDPDHFSVEGSGIQVRGLSGVASRLNGREIFSANAGRSLLWGDVTPELMQAVDVYKSSSADQIEGGTGGSVDLRTKLPFDFDHGLHVAASADLSVGDLANEADYSISGLIAGHWDTPIGEIGLLVDGAYSQLTSRSQFFRVEPYFLTTIGGDDYFIPGGVDYGEQAFQRKRDGIYAAAQWAPSSDLTFTGIFFQSRYRNRGDEWAEIIAQQTFAVDPSQSQFDSNGALLSTPSLFLRDPATFNPTFGSITQGGTTGVNKTRTKTQDMSLAFAWAPADSPLAIRGSYQHIYSTSVGDSLSTFRDFSGPTSYGLDLTGDLPVLTAPSGFGAAEYNDMSRYAWTAAMPHNEDNTGKMDSASVDIEYALDSGFFRKIKVGGRWANRTERDFNNGYAWAALGRGWNGDPQLTFVNSAPGDSEAHVYKDFFRGATTLPGMMYYPSIGLTEMLDVDLVHRTPPAGFCANPYYCVAEGPLPQTGYGGGGYRQSGFLLPNDQRDFETRTLAAYIMTSFDTPVGDSANLSGNVGVRVVNVHNESSGVIRQLANTYVRDGSTVTLAEVITPRSGEGDFTRFLPAINVIYAPDDTIRIRGAYNITMDNASFSALSAAGEVGVGTTTNPIAGDPGLFNRFTTTQGDPALSPAMSNNFDLSFEWYPRPGTTFHVAGFYKRITDLPIYSIEERPVTIYYSDNTTEDAMATSTAVRNADEAATVKGVEVGGRIFFDTLPGWLNGIGIEANYTFVDSANPGDLYRDIYGTVKNDLPLQGLSRHNFNVAFLYEHNPISFRVAYSWRSKYLQSTNSNGTNPLFNYYPSAGAPVEQIQLALPVYGAAYGSLDAGVTFRVTDDFSFTIQGTNLTNATQKTLMGGYPNGTLYTRSWFQSDRRIKMGVNLAF